MQKPEWLSNGLTHVPTARLSAFAGAGWILAWSLWRINGLRNELNSAEQISQLDYYILFATVAAVTLAYIIVGYDALRHRYYSTTLLRRLQGSPNARRVAWVTMVALWLLAIWLWGFASQFAGSTVNGPTLILIVSGLLVIQPHFKTSSHSRAQTETPIARESNVQSATLAAGVSSRTKTTFAILAISAVVLVAFGNTLFNDQLVPYGLDLLWLHYSLEQVIRQALAAGHLPLWNPYIFSGSPALAHPQYLVIYPPQMLLRLLPINLAFSWGIALHIWLAGLGMFFLARWFKLRVWIALFCGLIYMLNSGLILRVVAGHAWLLYALSWFPLAWLLLIRALDSGRAIFIVSAALTISLIILTGHPAFPLYLILFLTLYWLYRVFERLHKTRQWSSLTPLIVRFALIMAGALGFSAVQLVPSAVMAGQLSLNGGYSAEQANFLALSVTDLLALVIPHTYVTTAKTLATWELFPYFGILALLAIPFALLARPLRGHLRFLSAVSMLSLLIAFGTSVGIYSVLYRFVPAFRIARLPSRSLVMLVPTATIMGGFGLQAVQEHQLGPPYFRRLMRGYSGIALFMLSSALGVLLVYGTESVANPLSPDVTSLRILVFICALLLSFVTVASDALSRSVKPLPTMLLGASLLGMGLLIGAFVLPSGIIGFGTLLLSALFIGSNSLLLVFLYRYGPAPATLLLLFTLLLLDMGAGNLRHLSTTSPPRFNQETRVLLRDVPLHRLERVWSVGDYANHYALGGVAHIDGYNTGILGGYDRFLRTVTRDPSESTTGILALESQVDARALDFLGVRYIIRPQGTGKEELPLVASQNNFQLYANSNPMPRAFIVHNTAIAPDTAAGRLLTDQDFDYSKQVVLADEVQLAGEAGETPEPPTVSIEEYVPAHGALTMSVHMSTRGILVLSEPYYSERRAWVNGEEVDILRANMGFIAVQLEEGEQRVELRYVPSSLLLGGVITVVTILISIRFLLPFRRRQIR